MCCLQTGAQEQTLHSFDTPRGLEEAFLNFLAREDRQVRRKLEQITGFVLAMLLRKKFTLLCFLVQNPGQQTTILDQLCGALSVSTKYEQLGTVLGGSPFQPDAHTQDKDWEETCHLSSANWGRVRLLLERLLEEYPKEPLLHHLMTKACLRSGSALLLEGLEAAK